MKKSIVIALSIMAFSTSALACGNAPTMNTSAVKAADVNHDKKVSKDEFFNAYAPIFASRIKHCSDAEFTSLDTNSDGIITSQDYHAK